MLGSFSLGVDEDTEGALRAKLRELRVRRPRVHVGIPRARAVVKALQLPPVADADVRRMVGFELDRHLPFPASEAIFDFHVLDHAPGQPARVLLVATERRVFERIAQLLRGAGGTLRLVDVTIHGLAVLAARDASPQAARIAVGLEEADAELAVVRHGRPILSRAFPLPADLSQRARTLREELQRSLGSLGPEDRAAVADVTVTGRGPLPDTDWAGLPVHPAVTLPPGLGDVPDDPAFLPALAMALRRPGRGGLRTNLIPEGLRPRPFPWPVAVTAGLAAAALLVGLAIPGVTAIRAERRLAALNRAIGRLAPEVQEAEQLARAAERARREVETLRGFEARQIRALPVLRELTELLPSDVWLTNLSIDAKGTELAGFAAAAAQLIPLLEGSPTFERVEFTSPVTKGRDREQFRLKAGWEQPPGVSPARATPTRAPARSAEAR